MSFGIYLVGFIVLIIGLATGAHLLHVPPRWIGVGMIIMVGLGILTGVTTTRPISLSLLSAKPSFRSE
jgi:hypothetical protein